MKHGFSVLIADIRHEVHHIEEVLGDIGRLYSILSDAEPHRDQLVALAGYIQNFYNGIENIMKRVAKEYYCAMPTSELWHRELLQLAFRSPKGKVALLSFDTASHLFEYLAFRHVFVHGYGFQLSWSKMKSLIENVPAVWQDVKHNLDTFLKSIENT